MAVVLLLFMGISNAFVGVFAEDHGVDTLYVEYEDGTETETEVRDHPSETLHFDVYKSPASIVTSATLVLADGTEVEWEGHGDDKNILDDSEQGGYWHWVYTPAGVLTISGSEYTELEEEPAGSIIIEKELLDVDNDGITEDDTVFTVNVKGPYEYDANHTFSVDEPAVIENLNYGDYTIAEVDIPDGFEMISIEEEEITLSGDMMEVTVVVTNQVDEDIDEIVGDPGALIIEKLLLDPDEEEIDDDDTVFTVNIKGDDYDEDHEFSVNKPLVLDELEPGDYSITEVDVPEGFEFVSISDEMVTISEDDQEDILVTVTNQGQEDIDDIVGDPGALIIEKLLLDPDEEEIDDDDTVFTVNIKGDDYDEDHEFSVNEPLVLDELEPGDYSITEVDVPEGFEFVSISDEMVTISEDHEEDITVTVTNKVEEEADEEEIIMDDEVPLGDGELPRTGQRHPRDFYLLGLMISGFGLFLKRYLI